MDIYFKVSFFLMLFAAGLALSVVISQRAQIKKMREESRLNGELFSQMQLDLLAGRDRVEMEREKRSLCVHTMYELSLENYALRERLRVCGVSESIPGIEGFSSEKGGAPFSPQEYVAMGIGMITGGKGNVAVRRVSTMEQVPENTDANNGGQASAENN